MPGPVYIFIRNTGAPQYIIEWKPVTSSTWAATDRLIVNTNGVNFTTAIITVSDTSIDYNIRIMAKCKNGNSNYFYVYLQCTCTGVTLEAEWNNCICPEIQNISITE